MAYEKLEKLQSQSNHHIMIQWKGHNIQNDDIHTNRHTYIRNFKGDR